ncbi:hypothetical protein BGX31_007602, partial [Mortierella sp. GBA43]
MSSVNVYRVKVEELIRQSDIKTVSAKKIRKQIEDLTNTSLANIKHEFDDMVGEIYDKITDEIDRGTNGAQPPPPPPAGPPQINSFGFALPPTSYVAPPEPKPKRRKDESDDDDDDGDDDGGDDDDDDDDDGSDSDTSYSSIEESSGRAKKKAKTSSSTKSSKKTSKSSSKSSSKSTSKSSSKSSKKSSSSKSKDKDKPKAKRKQPTNEDGTPKVNNFTRPMIISDKLHDVIGHTGTIGPSGRVEMSRPEVVKQMWVYIKANSLQDEKDKRKINCDTKLK